MSTSFSRVFSISKLETLKIKKSNLFKVLLRNNVSYIMPVFDKYYNKFVFIFLDTC